MKKILLPILLALVTAFLLTGCGEKRSNTPATQAQTSQQAVADSQPVAEDPARATVAQAEQEAGVAGNGAISQPTVLMKHLISRPDSISHLNYCYSEGRAWVQYFNNNNEMQYGVIDESGNLVYSVAAMKLAEALSGPDIATTPFQSGVSCIYTWQNPGYIIIDRDGCITYKSENTAETEYFMLAQYKDTFIIAKSVKNFSENYTAWLRINKYGVPVTQELVWNSEYTRPDYFEYLGGDVFTHRGNTIHAETMTLWNESEGEIPDKALCEGVRYSENFYDGYYHRGYYDANGNMIIELPTFPEGVEIRRGFAFSGNYAYILLRGVDGKFYTTAIDHSGTVQFNPICIEFICAWEGGGGMEGDFCASNGCAVIQKSGSTDWQLLSPNGNTLTLGIDDISMLGQDASLYNYYQKAQYQVISGGFIFLDYAKMHRSSLTDDKIGYISLDGKTLITSINVTDNTITDVVDVDYNSLPDDALEPVNMTTNASVGSDLTPADYAYLSGYCNAAVDASNDETEIADIFYRLIQQNVPAEHPIAQLDRTAIHAYVGGSNRDMEAIVINYDYTAIVVFSGTHGDADIRTDIGIVADTSPAWLISALGNAFNALFSETPYEAAHTLLADLDTRYTDVIVCGHSLGGHLAVDVTLSFDVINACYAFDPPGRGDALIHDVVNSGREQKIINYCAEGSYVSMTGTQVGTVNKVTVAPNMSGTDNIILTNHGIYEIAEALGGSWGRETRNVETVSLPEEGLRNSDLVLGSANTEEVNLLNIRFNGHTYNLGVPYAELIGSFVNDGVNVVHDRSSSLYNSDGSIQPRGEGAPDLSYLDWSISFKADSQTFDECMARTFTFENESLSSFIAADNITSSTSGPDGFPEYYLRVSGEMTKYDEIYFALYIDGTPWNLQEETFSIPETLNIKDASDINENKKLPQPIDVAKPPVLQIANIPVEDFVAFYNSDPYFKNNIVIGEALAEMYASFIYDDHQNIGVIRYAYKDGVLVECHITVLTK